MRSLKSEQLLLLVLWTIVFGFLLVMVVTAWPQYWRFVAAETTPLAWLESVLLVLIAGVSGLIAYVEALSGKSTRKVILGWVVVAIGFAWLAVDERFALHERIRDQFLKPTGFKLLPWMEAGDWLIPLYMISGLIALRWLWQLIGMNRSARLFLVTAILISVCAVGMDTIDIRSLNKGMERLLQSIEEGLETLAMTSFLSAFLCVWMARLNSIIHQVKGT
ncbi:hypothetical protein [Cohnella sp. WQ 127256]|uniref:hypothetical protein n=1 Tax=Cohnella sp. WQ 127256 TaxID=2938790 RepID=UPI002118F633|nr:hypothetical protein [Cohnella sp. WQ 127256]